MTLVLTDDERTVLMIAAEGQSMMPIGRWEAPVEHLVEIGFLERHDKWNNLITTQLYTCYPTRYMLWVGRQADAAGAGHE